MVSGNVLWTIELLILKPWLSGLALLSDPWNTAGFQIEGMLEVGKLQVLDDYQ